MVPLAIRTMRVSEFLRNACQGFTVDVDAGREWLPGSGALDRQHAHDAPEGFSEFPPANRIARQWRAEPMRSGQ